MTVEQWAAWGQIAASLAVFVSLIFVAYELRMNTRVSSAQARHNLSHFAAEVARFKADNIDRLTPLHKPGVNDKRLSEADRQFRFWDHVQMLMHAETFFRHHQLGLMPRSHWDGYRHFMTGYATTPGFADCWSQMRLTVSDDFAAWIDGLGPGAAEPSART